MGSWAKKEESDLQDLGMKMEVIINSFADALDKVATHNENSRKIIKEIRTAEEAIIALQAKRKSTQQEIEKASKKQKPIGELSAELANIDRELLERESQTYTLKRQKFYLAMQLQFDALAEISAKTKIIADHGRQLAECIPQGTIYPGEGAPRYTGHELTRGIVAEMQSSLIAITPESIKIPINAPAGNPHYRYATDTSSIYSNAPPSQVSHGPPKLPEIESLGENNWADPLPQKPLYANGYNTEEE